MKIPWFRRRRKKETIKPQIQVRREPRFHVGEKVRFKLWNKKPIVRIKDIGKTPNGYMYETEGAALPKTSESAFEEVYFDKTHAHEVKASCPICGNEAKQFGIREEYRIHFGGRGRYYCDQCGWVEDHDRIMRSVIRKEVKEEQIVVITSQAGYSRSRIGHDSRDKKTKPGGMTLQPPIIIDCSTNA